MAVKQIPNLTPAVFLSPSAQLEVVQDGSTFRASAYQIADLISAIGGSGVRSVSTTLSGIIIDNPTTTPLIRGTLGFASGGTGLSAIGTAGQVLTTNATATALEWKTPASAGGGTVTNVSTTLSGITVDTPATTPVIKGTLGVPSGGTGLTAVGLAGQVLTTNITQTGLEWKTPVIGGTVTSVSTTLSGITIDTPTTTPVIKGTLDTGSGGTGLTAVGAPGQVLTTNSFASGLEWKTPASSFGVSTVVASYVLTDADANTTVQYDSASAGTITVPTNVAAPMAIGTEIEVGQINTGALTIAGSGGVTIIAPNGLYFNRQYQFARLRKTALNTWSLSYYGYPARADLPVYPSQNVSGAVTINRANGEVQRLVMTGNVSSTTITNFGTAGVLCKLVLEIWNTGAYVYTWPITTIWPNATAPVVTTGAGAKDIFILMTLDGGTTFYGTIVGQDYA